MTMKRRQTLGGRPAQDVPTDADIAIALFHDLWERNPEAAAAYTLTRLGPLSGTKAAERLGCSVEALWKRCSRARKILDTYRPLLAAPNSKIVPTHFPLILKDAPPHEKKRRRDLFDDRLKQQLLHFGIDLDRLAGDPEYREQHLLRLSRESMMAQVRHLQSSIAKLESTL